MLKTRGGQAERTAIVTGGGSGIGRAISLQLLREKYKVAILDLEVESALAVAEESGGAAHAIACDVTDTAAVTAAVSGICDDVGVPWLLVNNVGADNPAAFLDTTPEMWRRLIDVNLIGTLNMLHAVLPRMIAARWGGRVVNISSDSARSGVAGVAVYSACKGGIISLTRSLAREMAVHEILINTVCPGVTDTPALRSVIDQSPEGSDWVDAIVAQIPLGRMGSPIDVAPLVAFLAGSGGGFITGQTMSVSGGRTMT